MNWMKMIWPAFTHELFDNSVDTMTYSLVAVEYMYFDRTPVGTYFWNEIRSGRLVSGAWTLKTHFEHRNIRERAGQGERAAVSNLNDKRWTLKIFLLEITNRISNAFMNTWALEHLNIDYDHWLCLHLTKENLVNAFNVHSVFEYVFNVECCP